MDSPSGQTLRSTQSTAIWEVTHLSTHRKTIGGGGEVVRVARGGHFAQLRRAEPSAEPLATLIHTQFRATILSGAYPCLGGVSAVRRGHYDFALYPALGSPEATAALAQDLSAFVVRFPADTHPVAVCVTVYDGPVCRSEQHFEALLWKQLRGIHQLDQAESRKLPLAVSDVDGEDPGFVFADRNFFVVGLSPASSRWARRFGWPTLVFNALSHMRPLDEAGTFERMRQKIRMRDSRLQGSTNPSIELSRAAQFSGRRVGADWQCPVDQT
jgi:FPC/CPF motif-containing protein YcgG